MTRFVCHSVAETQALGVEFAQQACSGEVYALHGNLGAGKTAWAQGFTRGLGSQDKAHSPTFSLLNEYSGGRLPLYHLDLYRLETPDALDSAGLLDYLPNPHGVTLVEWAERWIPTPHVPKPDWSSLNEIPNVWTDPLFAIPNNTASTITSAVHHLIFFSPIDDASDLANPPDDPSEEPNEASSVRVIYYIPPFDTPSEGAPQPSP